MNVASRAAVLSSLFISQAGLSADRASLLEVDSACFMNIEHPYILLMSPDESWIWEGQKRLLRSDDGWSTWRIVSTPSTGYGKPQFVGTGMGIIPSAAGVWCTSDSGESWSHTDLEGWSGEGEVWLGNDGKAMAYSHDILWLLEDWGGVWVTAPKSTTRELNRGRSEIIYDTDGEFYVYQEFLHRGLREELLKVNFNGNVERRLTFAPGSVYRQFELLHNDALFILVNDRAIYRFTEASRSIGENFVESLPDEYLRVFDFGRAGQSELFVLALRIGTHEQVLLVHTGDAGWDRRASWPLGQVTDIEFDGSRSALVVGPNSYVARSNDGGKMWLSCGILAKDPGSFGSSPQGAEGPHRKRRLKSAESSE